MVWCETEQIQQFLWYRVCVRFLIYTKAYIYIASFVRINIFFASSPLPCWCVSVISAQMGIPSHVMGPRSRTKESGCAKRPSKQL